MIIFDHEYNNENMQDVDLLVTDFLEEFYTRFGVVYEITPTVYKPTANVKMIYNKIVITSTLPKVELERFLDGYYTDNHNKASVFKNGKWVEYKREY